jgi:hypothetical protein
MERFGVLWTTDRRVRDREAPGSNPGPPTNLLPGGDDPGRPGERVVPRLHPGLRAILMSGSTRIKSDVGSRPPLGLGPSSFSWYQ